MRIFYTIIAIITLSACGYTEKTTNIKKDETGYKLMKQYCYICHMPVSADNMIAPPLFRVKEHYLPVYKTEKEFVDAISHWAKNPSEEIALMPGALRKFEKMPAQYHIPDDTIRIIAKYIYNHEMEKPAWFDSMHTGKQNMKMMEGGKIELTDGKKINVSDDVINTMNEVKNIVSGFKGNSVDDYNKLGKDVFDKAKTILLDKNNKGKSWDNLHAFFNSMEDTMHSLISAKTTIEAKPLKNKLKKQIDKFYNYFE
jgi:hypothetical protein